MPRVEIEGSPLASDISRDLLQALSLALGTPVHEIGDMPPEHRRAVWAALSASSGCLADVAIGDAQHIACSYAAQRDAVIVAGPFLRAGDPGARAALPVLDDAQVERVRESLLAAAPGLAAVASDRRMRLELASRLEVVSSAILAVTGELSLDKVLHRIVDLARELAGARYAALGVPNAEGELVQFVTSGLTAEEEARIGARPRGRGILGLLLTERRSIRLADLREHPAAVGFPPGHPPMRSFLGVPIVAHGRVLGNLYLTEKRIGPEFTEADEQLIELIARHAAVAIENARLYSEIEAQRQRLQAVVDEFPEAILIAEASPPRITLANRTVSELVGWEVPTPFDLFAWFARNPRYRPDGTPWPVDELPLVRALQHGEHVRHSEVRIMRDDGSLVTVLLNAKPLHDASGRIVAAIAAFQDITRIKDAEHLKDDFLSLVSHELRTPLTAIQGSGMLLDREWDRLDELTRRELIGDIANESRRLGDLIENMVQLSNIRAGRLKLETEPVHLRVMVERAVDAIRTAAGGREFTVDVPSDLLADADSRAVDQVLRNLLHNAVKYAPGDRPIEVHARAEDGCAVVAVRDYGPGVDAEEIPFLFDRFRRSASARVGNVPGMGLGLYLAQQLVEANGGRIWVERPEGGGARFAFTLPRIVPDE